MDERLIALERWINTTLGISACRMRPASSDASFRRYFRVFAPDTTYIAMDAPPDKEDSRPYIAIAQRFLALGLNVPRVFAEDLAQGFLLIGDLGDRCYLPELNPATVERLYGDALSALIVLQAGAFSDDAPLPPYDAPLLQREMELFREWYLGRHLGLKLSAHDHAMLDETYALLTGSALAQPRVWVHRDYHSRNLMITTQNSPGILDFQDAVHGPVTYDLVSLLRDCYVSWPRPQVEDWVKGYHTLALQSGIPVGENEMQFLQWFDFMGVQRHLKATGIFARLNHRDGKPGYLNDIPRTLGYVLEVSSRYPALSRFHQFLQTLNLPGPQ